MEKTKENLKGRILEAIASGDASQMQALQFEVWTRRPARETIFSPEFQKWLKSDEVKKNQSLFGC
jgi:hypothetical protein